MSDLCKSPYADDVRLNCAEQGVAAVLLMATAKGAILGMCLGVAVYRFKLVFPVEIVFPIAFVAAVGGGLLGFAYGLQERWAPPPSAAKRSSPVAKSGPRRRWFNHEERH